MRYVAVHRHRFGMSVYPFELVGDEPEFGFDEDQVAVIAAKLQIDFEPHRDEFIDIVACGEALPEISL